MICWFDVLKLYFFGTFFQTFEGGRYSSSNQVQSTGNSILDDFGPSLKIEKKISKNQQNKRLDFRLYISYKKQWVNSLIFFTFDM